MKGGEKRGTPMASAVDWYIVTACQCLRCLFQTSWHMLTVSLLLLTK